MFQMQKWGTGMEVVLFFFFFNRTNFVAFWELVEFILLKTTEI